MARWLLLWALPLAAQVSTPRNPISFVSVAPAGACNSIAPLQYVTTSGVFYGCVSGTWSALNVSGSGTTGQWAFWTGSGALSTSSRLRTSFTSAVTGFNADGLVMASGRSAAAYWTTDLSTSHFYFDFGSEASSNNRVWFVDKSGNQLALRSDGSGWYFGPGLLLLATLGVCASSASPAVCSSSIAGSVVVAAAATTVQVNTSSVTNASQILLTFDSSLSSRLGVTCNTTNVAAWVSARSQAASFTITVASAPTTNPACFSYLIIN